MQIKDWEKKQHIERRPVFQEFQKFENLKKIWTPLYIHPGNGVRLTDLFANY